MANITIRISDEDKTILQEYSKRLRISMSQLLTNSAFEKIEKLELLDLHKNFLKDVQEGKLKTISHEDFMKEFSDL